jgi:hypothetical protein
MARRRAEQTSNPEEATQRPNAAREAASRPAPRQRRSRRAARRSRAEFGKDLEMTKSGLIEKVAELMPHISK